MQFKIGDIVYLECLGVENTFRILDFEKGNTDTTLLTPYHNDDLESHMFWTWDEDNVYRSDLIEIGTSVFTGYGSTNVSNMYRMVHARVKYNKLSRKLYPTYVEKEGYLYAV